MKSTPEQSQLEKQQKEIRKKYKEHGGKEVNPKLADSIQISAELEYRTSPVWWGGVCMADRFQSMLTGRAMTTNTQKVLDAEVLKQQENSLKP